MSGSFPPGFRWGVSTASYQIEGASTEDGRKPSVWDTFSHEPGNIADGSTGDVACDHYHRYADDVALMAELGVNAYRFSIAWPRVQPDGTGPGNPAGIAFYDRLVDALLERGIDPCATLFHWDLPQALQDDGGWSNRDTAHRFAEYAHLASAALGDRVKLWITLNEPNVHWLLGHVWGIHAPGLRRQDTAFEVAHHQLLGHGLAVAALRSNTSSPVTIANNYSPVWPVGTDGRRESATEADHATAVMYDAFWNRLFTDPLLYGQYPAELAGHPDAAKLDDWVLSGDLQVISAPLDALGVNYYNPAGIGAPDGSGVPYSQRMLDGYPTTYFGWPVVPDGLRELLVGLHQRYADKLPPIYITESGCTYEDTVEPDGSIVDTKRAEYHASHIAAVGEAIAAGVPVRGYLAWSLMDNFEWAEGYDKRFGLTYVDYATQTRTPKASFAWYRDHIAAHR